MSWQRWLGRGLEAAASLLCLGLLLAPAPAREATSRPQARHSGTLIAILGAAERDFGLWQGQDLTRGGSLTPRSRIAVAFRPSGKDQVQLFARSDLDLPREIPLAPVEGGRRLQAPAPGRTLVYSGGTGELLFRVCPPGAPPLELSTAAGLREVRARFAAPGQGARARGDRVADGPGWLARLPDGAPVEVPWRWLSGEGCVHRVVRFGEEADPRQPVYDAGEDLRQAAGRAL